MDAVGYEIKKASKAPCKIRFAVSYLARPLAQELLDFSQACFLVARAAAKL